MRKYYIRLPLILLFFIAACAQDPALTPISPSATAKPTITPIQPTSTHILLPSAIPTITPLPTQTPTPEPVLCSPLEDISLAELEEILSNPFIEPLPGRDDGHHGVDFAYYSRGTHKIMLGLPVRSLMSGRVAGIIDDEPPYGYALIVEIPLENLLLSRPVLSSLLPTPAPTIIPDARLTCPTLDPAPNWAEVKSSLYLLYAHLESAPLLRVGDEIRCGEQLGNVGTTGMSVNPHLHLEARIGPPNVTFPSLGHYGSVSTTEMAYYCLWRASQWFQMLDPMLIIRQ